MPGWAKVGNFSCHEPSGIRYELQWLKRLTIHTLKTTIRTTGDYPGKHCCITFVLMSKAPADKLNDKYLRLFGIPISVVALLLSQMPFFFPGRWDLFWRYTFVSILFTGLMWEISRFVLIRVRQRFPDLSQTRQRIAWTMLLFVVQLGIGQALITKAVIDLGWASISTLSFFQIWITNFAYSLFFIVVISSIYEAIYFSGQYKLAIQKAEQLKKQQAQNRLDALKSRVNPHFLFNSLTTLSALIGEDALRAEHFVDELSKVYRYLLRAGSQAVTTLGEECQFAESYAFLLKNRFEEGAFSFSDNCRAESRSPKQFIIPVLTLQNALDYLVRTQNTPLHIQMHVSNMQLRISCTNHPKSLAFDTHATDWKQLESQGASQTVRQEELEISIPIAPNPEWI